jgi:hypothetical protein
MVRPWLTLCCLLLAGCSTHPGADFLDYWFPGKVRGDPQTAPHGGVCLPQGGLGGPGVPAPAIPIAPVSPVPIGPPVFPGAGPAEAPPGFIPPPPPAPLP